jgi:hypothetical protein
MEHSRITTIKLWSRLTLQVLTTPCLWHGFVPGFPLQPGLGSQQ